MNENKHGSYHPRILISANYGQAGKVKPLTANRSFTAAVK